MFITNIRITFRKKVIPFHLASVLLWFYHMLWLQTVFEFLLRIIFRLCYLCTYTSMFYFFFKNQKWVHSACSAHLSAHPQLRTGGAQVPAHSFISLLDLFWVIVVQKSCVCRPYLTTEPRLRESSLNSTLKTFLAHKNTLPSCKLSSERVY